MNLKRSVETKHVKKIILLYQKYDSKDEYVCALQIIHRKTCAPVFIDLLNVDKAMVAYHEPKSLKDLLMPSKLKGFDDSKFQASAYVTKQKWIKVDLVAKDRAYNIVAQENMSEKMISRLSTTLALVGKEVSKKHAMRDYLSKKRLKIKLRGEFYLFVYQRSMFKR